MCRVALSARACFENLRPLGHYTQVGHFRRSVELNFDHVAFKQLQVRGSVGYTAATWSRTLRILQQGRLNVAEIISHRLPLSHWQEGFDLCERKEALQGASTARGLTCESHHEIANARQAGARNGRQQGNRKSAGHRNGPGRGKRDRELSHRPRREETVVAVRSLGRQSLAVRADVGRVSQIQRMFVRLREQFECLDVLVNNAGITGWSSLWDMTEERWDEVINVNAKGTFFCSLEAARWMREKHRPGSIINVSTNCAALGVKNLAAYAASKAAIHGVTRQLAVRIGPIWHPGERLCSWADACGANLRDDPDYDREWGSVVPLGRTALPEEMSGAVLFSGLGRIQLCDWPSAVCGRWLDGSGKNTPAKSRSGVAEARQGIKRIAQLTKLSLVVRPQAPRDRNHVSPKVA